MGNHLLVDIERFSEHTKLRNTLCGMRSFLKRRLDDIIARVDINLGCKFVINTESHLKEYMRYNNSDNAQKSGLKKITDLFVCKTGGTTF